MWRNSKNYENEYQIKYHKLFKDYDFHEHYFNRELNCIMCISKNLSKYHRITNPVNLKYINGISFLSENALEQFKKTKNHEDKKLIVNYKGYSWNGACVYVPTEFSHQDQLKIFHKHSEEIYENIFAESKSAEIFSNPVMIF